LFKGMRLDEDGVRRRPSYDLMEHLPGGVGLGGGGRVASGDGARARSGGGVENPAAARTAKSIDRMSGGGGILGGGWGGVQSVDSSASRLRHIPQYEEDDEDAGASLLGLNTTKWE